MLELLITIILWLPVPAIIILALFPLALRLMRGLPQHEYAQAVRAPAWFAVVIGGGIVVLSLIALTMLAANMVQARAQLEGVGQAREYINAVWPLGKWQPLGSWLMVDAFTLWGTTVIGAVLAVAAWVPAARRSLVPRTTLPFLLILLLAWFAIIMLFSIHFLLMWGGWLLLLLGTAALWWTLFKPRLRLRQMELPVVFFLSGLLGTCGLLWLNALARGDLLPAVYNRLLSIPFYSTNGVGFLLVLGWLGPAVYLPWWLWVRRDEETMVWLPAAMLLTTGGTLALVRVLFLAFPSGSAEFQQATGLPDHFLIARLLGWMVFWGMVSLLVGAGWLVYEVIRRPNSGLARLRPLALIAPTLFILGLVGGLLPENAQGSIGALWLHLAWTALILVWLAGGGLLPVLAPAERSERTTVHITLLLALAAATALPWMPAFTGMRALWVPLNHYGASPVLVLSLLGIATLCAMLLLPGWLRLQKAPAPQPGAAWGIIGPFLFIFLTLTCSLLAGPLHPVLQVVRESLVP